MCHAAASHSAGAGGSGSTSKGHEESGMGGGVAAVAAVAAEGAEAPRQAPPRNGNDTTHQEDDDDSPPPIPPPTCHTVALPPDEAAAVVATYPPYSPEELKAAKKVQLIPGEVLYCEGALKPSWRGVIHGLSLLPVAGMTALLLRKADTPTEHLACWSFCLCSCLLFLCSWLYHRVHWSPRWEVLMQKLDHCSIFLMVTGNVAPLSLLALRRTRLWVLSASCLVAAWGMVQIFRMRKSLHHFVFTGGVMVIGLWELVAHLTMAEFLLCLASWGQYALGMFFYAKGWPRLSPRHFSSHEVMHALIVSAAGTSAWVTYSLLDRFDVAHCLWAR